MAGNPDHLKVPKLMEGEQSYPSPISAIRPAATTTNGVADKAIPATTDVVADYVNPDDNNVHSDSVSGVDLEYQILQPSTDQRTPADVDVIAL
ncbi:AT-hook motif nuclear-localized protein 9-like [Sesbania bispinosa]|nr:AT-hook motif nuclear-localized protein 9-like [Sesbania bispinosa]